MSSVLQEAMKKVGLGVDVSGNCYLFMVNEAEAAATHSLTKVSTLEVSLMLHRRGNSVIIIDPG